MASPPRRHPAPIQKTRAPAPGTGYIQSGPRLTDQQIAEIAQRVATQAGDPSAAHYAQAPMTAADTTLTQAVQASGAQPSISVASDIEALMHSEVAVVVQHGRFKLTDAPVKQGSESPTGSVLTLAIDTHTGWVDTVEVGATEAPALAELGPMKALEG